MSACTSPARAAKTRHQIEQAETTARIIAEHRAAVEARKQAKLQVVADAVNPRMIWGAWTPEQIAEIQHLRREMKYTEKQLAAHFGISLSASRSAIDRHCRRAGQAAPKKRIMRKPEIEARLTAEKIDRKCLQCNKAFFAPTRFVRLCRPNCQGGE